MQNKEIIIFESLDSTNNYAMQKVHAGMAAHGDVFLALQQTAGKGQHGKVWLAEKGESILMSKVLRISGQTALNKSLPDTLSIQQFQLSAIISLAVRDWLANYVGDNIFIKWPDDIYCNDRKAGGILIENVLQGNNWKWAIVGIGINVNQKIFPAHLANPISLAQITHREYNVAEMANKLNGFLETYWNRWLANDWEKMFTEYNQNLFKRDQQVRLKKGNIVMPCTIKGVSSNGKLLIKEDDALSFSVGEVVFLDLVK